MASGRVNRRRESPSLTKRYIGRSILAQSSLRSSWCDPMRVIPASVRLGAVIALTFGLAACGGGAGVSVGALDFDEGLPHPRDYAIHGIDVSKYQGDIDWTAVKNSGVKF